MTGSVTIPAGTFSKPGKAIQFVNGSVFACYTASDIFDVRLGQHAERETMTAGRVIGSPNARKWGRVIFINTSATPVSVTFYAGTDEMTSADIPVVSEANVTLVEASSAPVAGLYTIQANNTVEQIAAGSTVYVTSIEIFPGKALSNGVITPNTLGDVYIGKTANALPYKRATTDTDYPAIPTIQTGQKLALSSIRVRGQAGDGVVFVYTPA